MAAPAGGVAWRNGSIEIIASVAKKNGNIKQCESGVKEKSA